MMMPANYSVIAENEMSYVNGGANFIDAIGAVKIILSYILYHEYVGISINLL